MPLFRQPIPDPPGPKAKPNAVREGDTIKGLSETRSVLARLIRLLSPYQPTQINAIGKRVEVLAIDLGDGPPLVAASAAPDHPFKVFVQNVGTPESPIWERKVFLKSDLLKSLRATDRQIITGLDTWVTLLPTDVIWLSITVNTAFATTAAAIRSYGLGHSDYVPSVNAWTTNGYVESSNNSNFFAVQNIARIMIAYSFPDAEGNPSVTQSTFTHLIMENRSISDTLGGARAAVYPYPCPTSFYGA